MFQHILLKAVLTCFEEMKPKAEDLFCGGIIHQCLTAFSMSLIENKRDTRYTCMCTSTLRVDVKSHKITRKHWSSVFYVLVHSVRKLHSYRNSFPLTKSVLVSYSYWIWVILMRMSFISQIWLHIRGICYSDKLIHILHIYRAGYIYIYIYTELGGLLTNIVHYWFSYMTKIVLCNSLNDTY